MKRLPLALALLFLGAVGQTAWSGTLVADVPSLGYSPQTMDRSVDPRQDFCHCAAGNWLRRTEIAPSDPDVGGFTQLAHRLDIQLLALQPLAADLQRIASARGTPADYGSLAGRLQDGCGASPLINAFVAWTPMWAFKARSVRLRCLVLVDVHAIASVRAVAPLLHRDAFHEAFGTRPRDPMWRDPGQRVVIG